MSVLLQRLHLDALNLLYSWFIHSGTTKLQNYSIVKYFVHNEMEEIQSAELVCTQHIEIAQVKLAIVLKALEPHMHFT